MPALARSLLPSAKVVVAVCDPVTRLWSQFHHALRYGFVDPGLSFDGLVAVALNATSAHASKRTIDHDFVEKGRYALRLLDWFAAFGQANVHVVNTDLTAADGAARVRAITDLLTFAGLGAQREHWDRLAPAFVNTMPGCACGWVPLLLPAPLYSHLP